MMIAFGDDPALKAFLLDRLAECRRTDRRVAVGGQGTGAGGAVARTLEALQMRRDPPVAGTDTGLYETNLGIPRMLAQIEDRIFENLAQAHAQAWPERFIAAIRPGAALDMVWPQFALWLLNEELLPHTERGSKELAAIADTTALYREWLDTGASPEFMRWMRQSSIARDLADAIPEPAAAAFALEAANKAAEAAGHAGKAAEGAEEKAARWATSAANCAAAAIEYAAEATYRAAYSAAAPFTADQQATHNAALPARAATARRQADKLIELLAAAAPVERARRQGGSTPER